MNKTTQIMLISFALFTTEALVHYNLGEYDRLTLKFPPTKEFIEILMVVAAFSIANGFILSKLLKL